MRAPLLLLALAALVGACSWHRDLLAALEPDAGPRPPAATTGPAPTGAIPAPPPPGPRVAARAKDLWFFEALTRDGRRALLTLMPQGRRVVPRMRVVDVESGQTVEELTLTALSKLPRETITDDGRVMRRVDEALRSPELREELGRAARLVAQFPLGASERLAATPEGRVAFNAGDWIYVVDPAGTAAPRRVSPRAAYSPWFVAGGKTLLFRRIGPSLDGVVSRYDLYAVAASLAGAPRRIDGTGETREPFALTADGGAAVMLASHPPQIKTCVVRVGLAPPFAARSLACFADDEKNAGHHVSPTGRFVEVTTSRETSEDDPGLIRIGRDGIKHLGKKLAWRRRVVRTEDGKVVYDHPSNGNALAVSDEGLVLSRTRAGDLLVLDAPAGTERTLPRATLPDFGFQVRFVGPREVVYADEGTVRGVTLP